MTAETSNARDWVLERLRGVLEHGKMGDKCLIAPDLVTAAIASLSAPPPPAARGDVPYDRELIAQMLDVCGHPKFTLDAYREQARLLREAAQAKPEARGVVDEVIDYHEFVPQEIYEAAQMIERFMSKKVNTPWAIAGIQSRDLTEARNVR